MGAIAFKTFSIFLMIKSTLSIENTETGEWPINDFEINSHSREEFAEFANDSCKFT